MWRRIIMAAVALAAVGLSEAGADGRQTSQEPAQKPRATRPAQKTAAEQNQATEAAEKADAGVPQAGPEELMRKSLDDLSAQINLLTAEVKRLRKENERNSDALQLLLYEDRLGKVEASLQDAINYKAQLDARELDLQRRSRNIQQEVMLRGGLRRDEVEAAVRADLQRGLDDVHSQQTTYQQRIADLQAEATRMRARVEALRKKVERAEPREEQQQ